MDSRLLRCVCCFALSPLLFGKADRAPINPETNWDALIESGMELRDAGHIDEAESKFLAAGRLAESFPAVDLRRATLLNNLGTIHHLRGQFREAIALFQNSASIYQQLPIPPAGAISTVWSNQATSLRRSGHLEEATALLQRALEFERRTYGSGDQRTSVIMVGLAWVAMERGLYQDARNLFETELRNLKRRHAAPTAIATVLASIGHMHSKCGEYQLAESCYRRALDMRRKALPAGHIEIYRTMSSLAVILTEAGRNEQAEKLLRQSLAGMEAYPPPDPADVATPLSNLAFVLADSNRDSEAEPLARRAIALYEAREGRAMEALAVRQTLAMIVLHRGKRDEAERILLETLHIREQVQGVDHPDLVRTIQNLAVLYTQEKRYQQAESLFQRAIRLTESKLGRAHQDLAIVLFSYSHLLKTLKRGKEATAARKRAEEITEEANVGLTGASTVDVEELRKP